MIWLFLAAQATFSKHVEIKLPLKNVLQIAHFQGDDVTKQNVELHCALKFSDTQSCSKIIEMVEHLERCCIGHIILTLMFYQNVLFCIIVQQGERAVDVAARKQHVEIVSLLMSYPPVNIIPDFVFFSHTVYDFLIAIPRTLILDLLDRSFYR